MAGFLYFKPHTTRNVTLAEAAAWGLGYAFEREPLSCACMANTPTGGAGVVFADPRRHADGGIKMDMDAQVWRKMPAAKHPELYIGYWKDAVPEPVDLARKNQLLGYKVELADGNRWEVPVVRSFDMGAEALQSNLPSYLDVDDNGNLVPGQVMPLYAHLWELTTPFAEQMLADQYSGPEVTVEEIRAAACRLLQVNYVVSAAEIAVIHLLTTEQLAHNIVAVAIDWPTYCQWRETCVQKKTIFQAMADTLGQELGHVD